MAEKAMQRWYYYTDVHVHGEYPCGVLAYCKQKQFPDGRDRGRFGGVKGGLPVFL